MTREYDPIEESMIQQAAIDALGMINAMSSVGAVSRLVQSGNTTFRLRLSIVDLATSLNVPAWHERPTGPGMWVCLAADPKRHGTVVLDLTADDLLRGSPFHTSQVFGPIPTERINAK